MKYKKCNDCESSKEISDFNNNIITKDGKSYYCRECEKEKRAEYNLGKRRIKICSKCKKGRSIKFFHNDSSKNDGKKSRCKFCVNKVNPYKLSQKEYYKLNKEKYKQSGLKHHIIHNVKKYITDDSIDFNILPEDIDIPEYCPILNIRINTEYTGQSGPKDNSPSIMLLDESKGYVKDNIMMVSYKANKIRKRFNPDDIRSVLDYISTNA